MSSHPCYNVMTNIEHSTLVEVEQCFIMLQYNIPAFVLSASIIKTNILFALLPHSQPTSTDKYTHTSGSLLTFILEHLKTLFNIVSPHFPLKFITLSFLHLTSSAHSMCLFTC